jgi:hypothetical protein
MDIPLHFTEIQTKLLAQGWTKTEANPFKEKVSHSADAYLTYNNLLKTQLGICVFLSDKLIKLRLENTLNEDFRWFQIEYTETLTELLDMLIAEQENASLSNYFSLYCNLSAISPTTFITWEQWESNHR